MLLISENNVKLYVATTGLEIRHNPLGSSENTQEKTEMSSAAERSRRSCCLQG